MHTLSAIFSRMHKVTMFDSRFDSQTWGNVSADDSDASSVEYGGRGGSGKWDRDGGGLRGGDGDGEDGAGAKSEAEAKKKKTGLLQRFFG